jgi:hypothetical protein
MAEYPLNRTVFKKDAYENAIDTSIGSTTPSSVTSTPLLEDTISVPEFFNLYTAIFYNIPAQGDINSHAYLAQISGDYANLDQTDETTQALLNEITELRKQNLELNQQIVNLQVTSSLNTNLPSTTI